MGSRKPRRTLSWVVDARLAESATAAQLAEGFQEVARILREIVGRVPHRAWQAEGSPGLSCAWVVGHLALLGGHMLVEFGGDSDAGAGSLLGADFAPGQDGAPTSVAPAALLDVFDRVYAALVAHVRSLDRFRLARPPAADDPFGLSRMTEPKGLRAHGVGALRYAGLYLYELDLLAAESEDLMERN